MDAWEQSYYEHRQYSRSPVRQAEHEMALTQFRQQKTAEQQAQVEDEGVLGRIVGLPVEVGKGVIEGIHQMGQNVLDLTKFLGSFVPGGTNPYAGTPLEKGYEETVYQLPKPGFEQPRGIPEAFARGLGQFAPLFFPASKALGVSKAATRLGRVGRGAAAGAVADFAGDPDAGNVFNVLSNLGGNNVAVFEALKTSPDEGQLRKRLKNALAGAPLGVGLDAAVEALTFLWKRGNLRSFARQIEEAFGEVQGPRGSVTIQARNAESLTELGRRLGEFEQRVGEVSALSRKASPTARFSAQMAETHNRGGGATLSPRRGDLAGTDAYSVAIPGRTQIIDGKEITPDDVEAFVRANEDLLKDDRFAVGSWFNEEDGKTYLDVVVTVSDREQAVRLGQPDMWDQIGVFDLGTLGTGPRAGQEGFIATGGSGGARVKLAPEDILRQIEETTPLDLEHYSNVGGIQELDPARFGTGQAGREKARADQPGFIPRTYFYEKGSIPEARFRGAPYKYIARLTRGDIYDIASDPLKLRAAAGGDVTRLEGLIRERGFKGYRNTSEEAAPKGAVAVFEKLPVRDVIERSGQLWAPLIKQGDEARARLKETWKRIGDPDVTRDISQAIIEGGRVAKDFAIYGAALIARGVHGTTAWTNQMVSEFGEDIRPYLGRIRRDAETVYRRVLRSGFDRATATKNLMLYLKEGKEGFGWYDKTLPELERMYGPEDARILIGFLAATSPNTTVKANVTLALKAFEQWKLTGKINVDEMGQELLRHASEEMDERAFKGFMGSVIDNLNRVLKGEPLSGNKVRNFQMALLGDKNAVVIDRWVLRALWPDSAVHRGAKLRDNQYEFLANFIRQEARARNMAPADLQAAIWVGIKKLKGTREDYAGSFEKLIQERTEQLRQQRSLPKDESFEDFSRMIDEMAEGR